MAWSADHFNLARGEVVDATDYLQVARFDHLRQDRVEREFRLGDFAFVDEVDDCGARVLESGVLLGRNVAIRIDRRNRILGDAIGSGGPDRVRADRKDRVAKGCESVKRS